MKEATWIVNVPFLFFSREGPSWGLAGNIAGQPVAAGASLTADPQFGQLRAELQQANKYSALNVDSSGEGSGLADELAAMGFPVNRVHFGANPGEPDYFDCRAEMFWQLAAAMREGMAIEPSDELEEELSAIGATRSLKEKSVDGTRRAVYWLMPKDEVKKQLGRSPDKADALALANYRARPKIQGGIRPFAMG